jgi:hypothetical protein
MRLGALHHPEKARLVAAAVEYHTKAVIGNGLVRAQLLDERVAPGGGVGVEALEVERVGSKACADAQVGARDLVVGRAVLVGDVLDQARAPAHCFSARHAHMARRRSWTRSLSAQVITRAASVVVVVVVVVIIMWFGWDEPQRAAICRRFDKSDAKQS